MPAQVANPDPRSAERAAALIVRMSREQRAALRRAAERRGTTVTALVMDSLAPVMDEEQRSA